MIPLPTVAVVVYRAIRRAQPEIAKLAPYRPGEHFTSGWCYAASELAYHLLGGKAAGWKPVQGPGAAAPHTDPDCGFSTHWWLEGPNGEVLDLTRRQYRRAYPYEQGRGRGFMTKHMSTWARELERHLPELTK